MDDSSQEKKDKTRLTTRFTFTTLVNIHLLICRVIVYLIARMIIRVSIFLLEDFKAFDQPFSLETHCRLNMVGYVLPLEYL